MNHPLDRLRYHVTGAIERGEAEPIIEQRVSPDQVKAEVYRLASLWATARVRRNLFRVGRAPEIKTIEQANERVEKAEKAFSDFLDQHLPKETT